MQVEKFEFTTFIASLKPLADTPTPDLTVITPRIYPHCQLLSLLVH